MPIYKNVNKDFFKKWSPDMAYVLGFLFADGNVTLTNRNTWFWSLQITDYELLIEIKKIIDSEHTISKRKIIAGHKQLYRLQIGSKEMCDDLIKLGLIQTKSNIMKMPNISSDFFNDFLRGYFDGDGHVWIGQIKRKTGKNSLVISTGFTSGSLNFLKALHKRLSTLEIKGGFIVKKTRGFELKYSIKDSLLLYKIMYNRRTSLLLNRKKIKFEEYLKSK